MCVYALTSGKHTSPTYEKPDFLEASSIWCIPTSITTAPGLIHEPRTYSFFPMATTKMSACKR